MYIRVKLKSILILYCWSGKIQTGENHVCQGLSKVFVFFTYSRVFFLTFFVTAACWPCFNLFVCISLLTSCFRYVLRELKKMVSVESFNEETIFKCLCIFYLMIFNKFCALKVWCIIFGGVGTQGPRTNWSYQICLIRNKVLSI